MNRVVTRLGFTTLALVAGSVAFAQSTTTGSISGVVSDANGAPIAGATVTATSSQTTRTVTTAADGSYRMGLMNPGEWQVKIMKAGLQTVVSKAEIKTGVNFTANFKMAAEAQKEVVVVGISASVDATNLTTGLNTSLDTIAAVPKGRDFSDLAFLSPGVVSSGFGNAPSIGGASGAENQYVVDGLDTTDFRRGFQGASFVNDFIEQVDIQTGGLKPEYNALGGVFNAVTRSGSNTLAGSAWLTWDAKGLQAVPKENAYFQQAGAAERYDIGGWLGGPIIKDKLFYFAGVDAISTKNEGLANNQGFRSDDEKITQLQFVGKINWFITQDQQLTAFLNVNDLKDEQATLRPFNGDGNLGGTTKNKVFNWSLNYDWTIRPDLFLTAKIGATKLDDPFTPTDNRIAVSDQMWFDAGPGAATKPAGLAANTTFRRGGAGYYTAEDKNETSQAKVDLSWFVGTHNIKAGLSWMESKYTEVAATSGGERVIIRNTGATSGLGTNPLHFGGVDRQFLSTNATVKADYTAFYIQDTWDVANSGFRVFYGFRYEIQDQKDLDGKSFLKFDKFKDVWQPRMGFTWDVFKDGQTKVSGSYARYFERIPQRLAIRVFANEQYLRWRYSRNSASAAYSTYNPADGSYTFSATNKSSITDFATPFSFDPIGEGTKLPQRDEVQIGLDQTLGNGWTVGIHGKYRKLKNPIEDSVLTDPYGNPYDEGPAIAFTGSGAPIVGAGAAILWNPKGSASWRPNPKSMTLYLLGLGATQNNYGITILDYYNPSTGLFTINNTNFDEARNTYMSADVTLERRTDRAYFNMSYTWSRLQGNYEGLISSSNGQADNNITASYDYYPYVGFGLMPLDRTHVAKAFGSYRFDAPGGDLTIGARWTYQSGTPKSLFDDGSTSNGYAPGWDTAHTVTDASTGHTIVVNTQAFYDDPNNYDVNGNWTGANVPAGVSATHGYLDIGGYGNAVPANGQLGQYGRNPATNVVDLNLTYSIKLNKTMKLSPSVDIFNVFNSRVATGSVDQATTGAGTANATYGVENGWQVGRRYRFGVKFQF